VAEVDPDENQDAWSVTAEDDAVDDDLDDLDDLDVRADIF